LLVVDDLPRIVQQPQATSVFVGSAAVLSVSAEGAEPLTYQWYRDGVALSGEVSPLLTIGDVAGVHAGDYHVEVSNFCGALSSDTATLEVTLPAPTEPEPLDGGVAVPVYWNLGWQDVAGASSYVVHFGTESPPPSLGSTPVSRWILDENMAFDTTYYWQVVARTTGVERAGPIWSFTTEPAPLPPVAPSDPYPADGATAMPTDVQFAWADCAGAESYSVLAGTDPGLKVKFYHANVLKPTEADTMALQAGTTYYWQVVASNAYGDTPGPVWQFSTAAAVSDEAGQDQPAASDDAPADESPATPGDGSADAADQGALDTPLAAGCPMAAAMMLLMTLAGLWTTRPRRGSK
jgi:hypothetical protein